MSKVIYLDYAASTPVDRDVLEAMRPYFSDKFYNPSSEYLAAKDIRQAIEDARKKVAGWFGARPSEVVFTAGGTEANNLAIQGVMRAFAGKKVVISAVEHDSVLKPAGLFKNTIAKVDSKGAVNLAALKRAIGADTVLVSVMYANNEVGVIQPIKQIAEIIAEERAKRAKDSNNLPVYLHVDACQAPLYLDLHVDRLGVDLMTINGGKIYGPKQSGALYVRTGVKLLPLILGGGQESNRRSGTENVPAIIGLATALTGAQTAKNEESKRLAALQQLFFLEISKKSPEAVINGSIKNRLPNNVHLTLPGLDNERLMMELDELGIQCGVGSACSASKEDPSHVLLAMGISDQDARSSLRFSMGRSTNRAAVMKTVNTLSRLSAKITR